MNVTPTRVALSLVFSGVILAACGGSTGNTPSAATALPPARLQIGGDAALPDFSGEYGGTLKDKVGTGTVRVSLAQYKGALGGTFKVKTTKSSQSDLITFAVLKKTLTGTIIYPGTTACTFATSSTYNATTHQLSGQYQAVYGCTGQSGTYTLKQRCYYVLTGTVGPENGLKQC